MRKTWISLAALCLLLSACGPRGISDAPHPATASANEPASPGEEALKVNDFEIDVAGEAPEQAMRKAVDACADFITGLNIPEGTSYYPLTREQTEAFLNCIAKTGAPVVAYGFDMRNYEPVEAFAAKVQAGEDAQTGVFQVSENGLTLLILAKNRGQQMYQRLNSYFPCTEIQDGGLEKTKGMELQENGYFLYGELGPENEGWCDGFRVLPLGEERREACRTYVEPIFYSAGKLMKTDWSEGDLSGLQMNFAFESLYHLETGVELYDAGFPQNDQNFTYSIPAEEVERVLTAYLPVTVEQIRKDPNYDGAQGVYHWGCFAGGGYAPSPEVAEIRENNDGTITLLVNSVSVEFGEACTGQAELTVELKKDGSFRYISNRMLNSDVW